MRFAAALLLAMEVAAAQGAPAGAFEAASVKPADMEVRIGPLRGGPGTSSPGQISGVATIKALLLRAYRLKDYQISGPGWMDSSRYEIAAKVPQGATREQVSHMWQALLAERFGLRVHRETKELAMYALVKAKSGVKLKPDDPNEASSDAADTSQFSPNITKGADGFPDLVAGQKLPRSYEIVVGGTDGIMYKLWAHQETMELLADRLSSQLSRPVVDETGLHDTYDFALSWTVETGGRIPRTGPPPDEIDMHDSPVMTDPGLSIFTALPAQLGLRLEARRGPVEILVVDKVDKIPTGN
jgi:uncharacterized protein (TIGR03435 family)